MRLPEPYPIPPGDWPRVEGATGLTAEDEAAEMLCDELRRYVRLGCEIELRIAEVPADAFEEQNGRLLSQFAKHERVGDKHGIVYWKKGG